MPSYAVGVDSGTQGTKALVVDAATGRVLGRGRAPHAMVPGLGPGASEQDPAVWIEAARRAVAAALRESRIDAKRVAAIGVSGQQHGFVPLDAKGRVIRPAKLWNDTSTVRENEDLVAALGGVEAAIARLGLAPAVGFTASKILWFKRHEPKPFARLATVLLPHNYLNRWLTGRDHMEYGDASGTGLMDVRRRRWDEAALAAVDPGLQAKLPPLSPPREPVGHVRGAVAREFGFGRVLVAAGGGDNMMGAVGSGNVRPGVCTLSLGTSGTVYAYAAAPFVDPTGEIAAFCDSTGGWLPLLCTMNVTNTTEIVKSLFGLDNTSGEEGDSPKDVMNLRLQEVIGGKNARAEESGYLAYGGVFLESFRQFSTLLPAPIGLASTRFEDVFEGIAPFLCGQAIEVDEYPDGPRAAEIAEAIRVLGNLIGSTLTHEVGHSLGLSLPYGAPTEFHNLIDLPNAIMDAGSQRPFEERAELDGQGPAVFNAETRAYLEERLPLR